MSRLNNERIGNNILNALKESVSDDGKNSSLEDYTIELNMSAVVTSTSEELAKDILTDRLKQLAPKNVTTNIKSIDIISMNGVKESSLKESNDTNICNYLETNLSKYGFRQFTSEDWFEAGEGMETCSDGSDPLASYPKDDNDIIIMLTDKSIIVLLYDDYCKVLEKEFYGEDLDAIIKDAISTYKIIDNSDSIEEIQDELESEGIILVN